MKWKFLGRPWLWWSKISEIISWNCQCKSWFFANPGKFINVTTRFDPFLFIQKDFFYLQVSFQVSLPLMSNLQQAKSSWIFIDDTSVFSKNVFSLSEVSIWKAICKHRHWHLGIGIGIGTETIDAIISTSIRSMNLTLSKFVI